MATFTVEELSLMFYDIVPDDGVTPVTSQALFERMGRETSAAPGDIKDAFWVAVEEGWIVRVPDGVSKGTPPA